MVSLSSWFTLAAADDESNFQGWRISGGKPEGEASCAARSDCDGVVCDSVFWGMIVAIAFSGG
jgi:hypothetical protein